MKKANLLPSPQAGRGNWCPIEILPRAMAVMVMIIDIRVISDCFHADYNVDDDANDNDDDMVANRIWRSTATAVGDIS